MTDRDFDTIKHLAKLRSGIELGEHKKEMIYSRIVRRIRALNLGDFKSYLDYLERHPEAELTNFINAITTNLTSFFREAHHFDFLRQTVLPELQRKKKAQQRIRIWSAGCSTGEEPYSIAMTLHGALERARWDAKILATDLDTNVLSHGRRGIYSKERIGNMDAQLVRKYFNDPRGGGNDEVLEARESIRSLITFNHLNLLGDWPMKGRFDVIFCRNVVIYFSKETQRELFDRYADILEPDGYLFIGHSESLHGVSKRFESVGRTIYRKVM
ncbi:CheR family methyltransferase [Ketobacter sp.]|uniref:CheR family methyltransferase n=1 Tax=Ketobacter sp. TaxID=2083498 RepID=UPI000F0D2D5C|nr:protein-glutamate O-methyltransferase [Ketobacter sp.]RLT92674.1 MAG: chemotaxis protein CheR [Ketobacter sp.]